MQLTLKINLLSEFLIYSTFKIPLDFLKNLKSDCRLPKLTSKLWGFNMSYRTRKKSSVNIKRNKGLSALGEYWMLYVIIK